MFRNHQDRRAPSLPDSGVPVASSASPPHTPAADPAPEVQLNVFGPLRITLGGRLLKPSGRAATLLTYLALERAPLHRMAAARLLWPQAGKAGLQNLRVELSVLRRQGIDLSPHRAPHLTLRAVLAPAAPGQADEPLADFNDHGNPLLRDWAAQQRLRLRHQGAGPGLPTTSLPAANAEAGPLAWLASQLRARLEPVMAAARQRPQLLVYVGRQASGRRESLRRLLPDLGFSVVELTAGPSSDEMLPSLLLNLCPLLEGGARQDAEALLHTPPESMLAQLGRLLRSVRSPLAVVVHCAERFSAQSIGMLDFLMDLPRPLLTVAVTTPAGAEGLELLLSAHARPGQVHVAAVPLLSTESFADPASDQPGAFAQHAERVRQSEGWLAAASSPELQAPLSGLRARLNADVKRILRAEVSAAGLALPAFRVLAAVPSPFSESTALKLLTGGGRSEAEAHAILEAGLASGVLERVADVVEVSLPQVTARVPDGLYPLAFTSELQRAALAAGLDPSERTSLRQLAGPLPLSRPRLSGVLEARPAALPATLRRAQTHRLPGGFLLLPAEDGFSVMRLGAPGHAAPTLYVQLGAPPETRGWQFDLQLQGLDPAAVRPAVHVVAPDTREREPAALLAWSSDLAPDTWYRVAGTLGAAGRPQLRLCVQGNDVLMHVTGLSFF